MTPMTPCCPLGDAAVEAMATDTSTADVNARDTPCDCVGADLAAVHRTVAATGADHENLFSSLPVVISARDVDRMQAVIDAVERIVELPGYQDAVLAQAPSIARIPQASRGVFLGFDFHIGAQGPRLIEINTNAGGAMLSAAVRGAQLECCEEVRAYLQAAPDTAAIERSILEMFRAEWRLARGDTPLRRLAIVDDGPREQFLYPEFLLFQRLFERHGIEALIADARELEFSQGELLAGGRPVDLVYNRSTDFYFEAPSHTALAEACRTGAAVVTPHPRAHALYASKRNLVLLSDPVFLAGAGATPQDVDILVEHLPRTKMVEGQAESWWAERKRWFFKPVDGFGSRGSYRGDKLTRRVFAELLQGRYVAQELSPPGERRGRVRDATHTFKVDVRNYVYAGKVQQRIARLYQGQTTNFRTEGGGFAPVYVRDVVT